MCYNTREVCDDHSRPEADEGTKKKIKESKYNTFKTKSKKNK
jgi:hypothetical protein